MKIKAKITAFTSLTLVATVVLITYMDTLNIKRQGREQLVEFREESTAIAKQHLQDLVDVAYATIDDNYKNLNDLKYLSRYYEKKLKGVIDTADNIVERYKDEVKRGRLSLSSAQEKAKSEIANLRYDNGTGYIWINDRGRPYPRMVMHPTVPSLDGTILNDPKFNNALGIQKNLFQAFVEVTSFSEDGFVDYLWPKPTKDGVGSEYVPKLSYVRRVDDWGWILGTGVYIDDAKAEIENHIREVVKTMRYGGGVGYFWINDNTLPFPTMVMHPTLPELDGKVLDDPKFNNALGKDQNLFQAFAEVTKENGSGFVDYLWPKPTKQGLTETLPKISYVRLHEPSGWIIGSGVYVDYIDDAVNAKEQQINQQVKQLIEDNVIASSVLLIFVSLITYLFATSFSRSIQNLTFVAEQISKGKDLNLKIEEIGRKDEIGELAKSIDRLKNSTKIMFERLTKKAP